MERRTGTGYGKILLVGGYTVLKKPNKALVLSVKDAFVRAHAIPSPRWRVVSEYGKWEGENPSAMPDELRFIRHAALEARTGPHEIVIESSPLFGREKKAGFGSSAAVTHAVLEALRPDLGKHELFVSAYRAHHAAQGKIGSGFDIAASVFGTIVYERPSGADCTDYHAEKIRIPEGVHFKIYNIDAPGTDTPTSAKKVLVAVEKNPRAREVFGRLAAENNAAVELFRKGEIDAFLEKIPEINELRAKLGSLAGVPIEPPELSEVRRLFEKQGHATILPGAGGYDSLVVVGRKHIKDVKHEMLREVRTSFR